MRGGFPLVVESVTTTLGQWTSHTPQLISLMQMRYNSHNIFIHIGRQYSNSNKNSLKFR